MSVNLGDAKNVEPTEAEKKALWEKVMAWAREANANANGTDDLNSLTKLIEKDIKAKADRRHATNKGNAINLFREQYSPTDEEDIKAYGDRLDEVYADENAKNEEDLVNAAKEGNIEEMKSLIQKGADVNSKDKDGGYTLLILAIGYDYADIVTMLIKAGADVDAQDNKGNTPIIWAIRIGRADIVTMLIDAGADLNTKYKDGNTALSLADLKGHTDIVKILTTADAKKGGKRTMKRRSKKSKKNKKKSTKKRQSTRKTRKRRQKR